MRSTSRRSRFFGVPTTPPVKGAPNTDNRTFEIDIVPAQPEQLSLSHSRLQGDEAEGAIRLASQLGEEARELIVFE
jgi:hypothetical protein